MDRPRGFAWGLCWSDVYGYLEKSKDINRINNSLLVATLILSLAGEMLFEGQIPTDCPAFVLNAYMLCLGSAVFYLCFAILFGIIASSQAYKRASTMLTSTIRPQWQDHFTRMKKRQATENTATFESHPISSIMMPPLASRIFRSWRRVPNDEASERERAERAERHGWTSPSFVASYSNRTEASAEFLSPKRQKTPKASRWRRGVSMISADSEKEWDLEVQPSVMQANQWYGHVEVWKDPFQKWKRFSSCMFKSVARGTMNLLEACGYLAVGTLYGGYADAWAFWAIQFLFTVIHMMTVYFLLDSFEYPKLTRHSLNNWLLPLLQKQPSCVSCVVASGPLFCTIAAATAWVQLDRFLIPLCYGTHFLVNLFFVSLFTTEEEVQEKHHDSDSEVEEAQESPILRQRRKHFLPVVMLRRGTGVPNSFFYN